jgi:hypothetical protein
MLADEYFRSKENVPSEMRTAEWNMAGQWAKERAFYSAGVAEAEILDEFRKEAMKVVDGSRDESTARKNLQLFLDRIGYRPAAGQEGTIKDFSSLRRLTVMLRTNRQTAQGYAEKIRGFSPAAIRLYPAWELVRLGPDPMVPREWHKRWAKVGGELTKDGRMIALKQDLIWQELGAKANFDDALDVSYPPFAWQSGMGWMGVKYKEAKELGLLDGWTVPETKPLASPNESLEVKPRIQSPFLRKTLAEKLKGLAEWDGDVLRFTDPNGTRPATAEQIAAMWEKGMPKELHRTIKRKGDFPGGNDEGLRQRFALLRWIENHDVFTKTDGNTPGQFDWYDEIVRLFGRIKPMTDVPIYRGLSFQTKAQQSEMVNSLRIGEYVTRVDRPAESWSRALSGARKYYAAKKYRILLVSEKNRSGKDISPMVRSIQDRIASPNPKMPLVTDGEVIMQAGTKFKVLKETQQEDVLIFYVEEL